MALMRHPAYPYPGIVRNSVMFGAHVCPVECTAKLLLFLCLSTIILYVPLGRFTYCEPSCNPNSNHQSKLTILDDNTSAMCCLCDLYQTTLYLGHACTEVFDQIAAFIFDSLYEAKLQFYRLLGSLDNYDLCRSVCCDEKYIRACRCPKPGPCKLKS